MLNVVSSETNLGVKGCVQEALKLQQPCTCGHFNKVVFAVIYIDRNGTVHIDVVVTWTECSTTRCITSAFAIIIFPAAIRFANSLSGFSLSCLPLTSSACISPFTTHVAALCDRIRFDRNAGLFHFNITYGSPPSICKCKHEEADEGYHNISHSSASPILYLKYENECGRCHHGNKHTQASQQKENFPTKLSYIIK